MMTKEHLNRAFAMAKDINHTWLDIELRPFDGFGLPDFEPITCTLESLAGLIRWQCINLDGSIDIVALNEIAAAGRRKFMVLDQKVGA